MSAEPAAAPVCVFCWPTLKIATCNHQGHPCCGRGECLNTKAPGLPSFMLKPRRESLFDEA